MLLVEATQIYRLQKVLLMYTSYW